MREEEGQDDEVEEDKGKEEGGRGDGRSTLIRISNKKNPKLRSSEANEDSESLESDEEEGGEEKQTKSLKLSDDDSTSSSLHSDHSNIITMNFSDSDIANDSDNAQQTKWSVPCEW